MVAFTATVYQSPTDLKTAVDAIVDAFDNTTPVFPTKGIYDVDVDTFGDPPDVDNDPNRKIPWRVLFFYG